MTYSCPELLLVGAAQSLVLDGLCPGQETGQETCIEESDLEFRSDVAELW